MDLHTRIHDSFIAQGFLQTLGASLDHVTPGEITISVPLGPKLTQQQGFSHGGVAFSIADSAAGYAALSLMAADQDVLTAEIKINLLAPARGDLLVATGRVIKPGRRLMVVGADVHALQDGKQTLIAVLQGTMIPVDGVS